MPKVSFLSPGPGPNNYKPNFNGLKKLHLKDSDRIGFKSEGKIIFATKRTTPGTAKRLWNDAILRTAARKHTAQVALRRVRQQIDKNVAGAWDVEFAYSKVKEQIKKFGSVRAEDFERLNQAIKDAEREKTEKETQLRFDLGVRDVARMVDREAKEVVDGFPSPAGDGFRELVRQLVDFDPRSGASLPAYTFKLAQPFAASWLQRPAAGHMGPSAGLVDSLSRLVLQRCGAPAPEAEPQSAPRFTLAAENQLRRLDDGEIFAPDPSVQFGKGGNGSVQAFRSDDNESLVVKRLIRYTDAPSRAAEALAEARVHSQAAGANGDHIVGIHGTVNTPAGDVLLMLEHAPNGESTTVRNNIDAAVQRQSLALEAATHARMLMFTDMVMGAAQAHENGVMHLDIKPENYFVSRDDRMLLGDFGTSCSTLAEFGPKSIDSIDYTAPEVQRARRQPGLVTHKADVWSLGVVLYELNSPRKAGAAEIAEFGISAKRPFPYRFTYEGAELIDQFVELPAPARFEQLELDPHNPLHQLIVQMLDPEPVKRPSLRDVLEHPLIAPYARPAGHLEQTMVSDAREVIRRHTSAAAA